jgi:endonuclease G
MNTIKKTATTFTLITMCLQLSYSQNFEFDINKFEKEKLLLQKEIKSKNSLIIELKQQQLITELKEIGLPSKNYIEHKAMIIEYSEEHEQAVWVAHMILPEIKNGLVYRSNDFRIDPKISTGTARQEDFFLTDTLSSGEVIYKGFG